MVLLHTLSGGLAGAFTGFVLQEGCNEHFWLQGDSVVWDTIEHFTCLGVAAGLSAGIGLAFSRQLLIRVTLAASLGILLVALAFQLYSEGRPVYIWGTGASDRESPLFRRSLDWGLFFGGPGAAVLALTGAVLRRTSGRLKLQSALAVVAILIMVRSLSFFWDALAYNRFISCSAPCHMSCHHGIFMGEWSCGLFLVLNAYALQLWIHLLSQICRPTVLPAALSVTVLILAVGLAWAGEVMPWTTISRVEDLRFDEETGTLLTLHQGEALREWEIREAEGCEPPTVELVRTRRLRRGSMRCVSFALGPSLAAAGTADGHISLWNPHTMELLSDYKASATGIGRIRISADGSFLACMDDPTKIRIWRLEEIYETGGLQAHHLVDVEPDPTSYVVSFDFTAKSSRMLTTTGSGFLSIHDVRNGKLILERECVKRRNWYDETPVFAADVRMFAYRTRDGTLLLEDRQRNVIRQVEGWGKPLCFSPDRRLLVASSGEMVQIIATSTGSPLKTVGRPSRRTFAAFSPDGRWLVLVDPEATFEVLDCRSLPRAP